MKKKRIKFASLFLVMMLVFPVVLALPVSAEETPESGPDNGTIEYTLSNVVNYEKKETVDENTIGLFHLDGNFDSDVSSSVSLSKITNDSGVYFVDEGFNRALKMKTVDVEGNIGVLSLLVGSDVGKDEFTIEMRVYVDTIISSVNRILYFWGRGNDYYGGSMVQMFYQRSSDKLFYTNWGGAEIAEITLGRWHTFCLQREGNVLYFYVDGIRNTSARLNASTVDVSDKEFMIRGANTYLQEGEVYIDEIRVSKGARYSGNYIPSQEPFVYKEVEYKLPIANSPGTVAIQSDTPAGALHVGEQRPTTAAEGDVYLSVAENEGQFTAQTIQQYQGGQWQTVSGSIYDNGAWNNAASYDITSYVDIIPPIVIPPDPPQSELIPFPGSSPDSQPDDDNSVPVGPGGGGTEPPAPKGDVGAFVRVMSGVYTLFRQDMNIYGFVFSFWDVLMYGLVTSVVLKFVGYVFYED